MASSWKQREIVSVNGVPPAAFGMVRTKPLSVLVHVSSYRHLLTKKRADSVQQDVSIIFLKLFFKCRDCAKLLFLKNTCICMFADRTFYNFEIEILAFFQWKLSLIVQNVCNF